ncbi:hypothetical protein BJV74DRAFT_210882 [Russula compacta]|nr:hypothetical protein BJV74DRAFT_210882 [Russula compacta]
MCDQGSGGGGSRGNGNTSIRTTPLSSRRTCSNASSFSTTPSPSSFGFIPGNTSSEPTENVGTVLFVWSSVVPIDSVTAVWVLLSLMPAPRLLVTKLVVQSLTIIVIARIDTIDPADHSGGYNGHVGDCEGHAVFNECRDDDGDAAGGDDVRCVHEGHDGGHDYKTR